jgi:hypothetical protein
MAYDREGVGTVAAAVHIVFAVVSLITFVGFWTLFVLDRWHRTQRTGVHAALRFLGVISSTVSVLFWIDPNSTWRMSPFWASYILQAAQTGLASTTLVYVAWLTDRVWRKSLSLPESRWMRVISLVLGGLVAVNNTVLGILSGALLPQCCVPQTVMLLVWSSAMLVFTFIWVVSLIRVRRAPIAESLCVHVAFSVLPSWPLLFERRTLRCVPPTTRATRCRRPALTACDRTSPSAACARPRQQAAPSIRYRPSNSVLLRSQTRCVSPVDFSQQTTQ